MTRISISPNLFLDEYIPKNVYLKYQDKPWILMGLIDSRLVKADQLLRDHFGPVTINNWWDGGPRNWSGVRNPDSPEYKPESQHTFGRASDKLFKNASAEEVRQYIIQNHAALGITRIEKGVSWVHSDIAWINGTELVIV